jgi:hypothetical protein
MVDPFMYPATRMRYAVFAVRFNDRNDRLPLVMVQPEVLQLPQALALSSLQALDT